MKFIPAGLALKASKTALSVRGHSPTILFAVGVVGSVTTVVLACRATLKAQNDLEDNRKDMEAVRNFQADSYSEQDRRTEISGLYIRKVLIISKCYAPTVFVGVFSIAALTGSHKILTNRNTGLTLAYGALDRLHREYRIRVAEEVGEEKERELHYTISERKFHDTEKGKIVRTGTPITEDEGRYSMYARFFDENSPSWEPANMDSNFYFLRCQQTQLNWELQTHGYLFLNDVYKALGMPKTTAGQLVGWLMEGPGDHCVDFGIFKDGDSTRFHEFIDGKRGIWLDFNVDGPVFKALG